MFNWTLEWIWLGCMTILCLIAISLRPWQGRTIGIDLQIWAVFFAILSGASALSLAFTLLRQQPINERDIAEMFRFPIYGVFVCFLAICARGNSAAGLDRVMRLALLYVLGCAAIYQFQIPVLYSFLSGTVYAEAKVLFGAGVIRIPFPFENPNFLAYFLILALVHFGFLRRNLLFLLLTISLLFLTGSRSGWLAALAVLTFVGLDELTSASPLRRVAATTLLILFVSAVTVYWDQLSKFARLTELLGALQGGDLQRVDTARIRLEGVAQMLNWLELSPILGWGPGRALELDVADNQYLSWILAWGLLGATLIIILGATVTLRLWSVATNGSQRLGILALGAGLGAMLGTGDFLENYRLFFLTFVFVHIFYESIQRRDCSQGNHLGC